MDAADKAKIIEDVKGLFGNVPVTVFIEPNEQDEEELWIIWSDYRSADYICGRVDQMLLPYSIKCQTVRNISNALIREIKEMFTHPSVSNIDVLSLSRTYEEGMYKSFCWN